MNDVVRRQISEDMAQLGIKKGSRAWPLLAAFFSAILLTIYMQAPTANSIDELFKVACRTASEGRSWLNTTVDAPGIPRECLEELRIRTDSNATAERLATFERTKEEKFQALEKRFAGDDVNSVDRVRVLSQLLNPHAPVAKSKLWSTPEGWWRLFVDISKEYFNGLTNKLGTLAKTAGLVALVSLIPGVFGMVYRRNFLSWFLVPFVILYLIVSDVLWRRSDETTFLLLVLSQVGLLLVAFRLRRYTRDAPGGSPTLHNGILIAVLAAIAVAIGFKFPDAVWTSKLMPDWLGYPFFRWELILVVLPVLYTLLRRSDVWSGQVRKNIVACLDGTTNTPDQLEFGRLAQTNVFKLYKMLKSDKSHGGTALARAFNASIAKSYKDRQIAFYYSGVGNRFENDPIVQTLGGATGLGAADVVDRAYLDILRVYQPGDRVFIFGFSRGAAIARLLARALNQRGAPQTIWTLRLLGRHWTVWRSKTLAHQDTQIPVAVLGCWDTVGAFGLAKKVGGFDFQRLDLFKDLTVTENVDKAYHMVALDEMRTEFSPTLMDPDPISPERIVEVWFSGDHANVGGGWATTKLSDVTLDFLLKRVTSGYASEAGMKAGAETWGLHLSGIDAAVVGPDNATDIDANTPYAITPDPLGQLRQWKSALFVYGPRELPHHAVISDTVFRRMSNAAPLYAPPALFNLHDELDKRRASVDAAIKRFKDTDSLTQDEQAAIGAFKDKLRLTRWPAYLEALDALPDRQPAPSVALAN